jgi:hypothetical protein
MTKGNTMRTAFYILELQLKFNYIRKKKATAGRYYPNNKGNGE